MKTTKCPESLCPALRYLHWRGVSHLLGGRCPSIIAPTDSCAKPAWLSPPSVFSLVRGVFTGRFQPLLPTGSSRRYLCESFLGCLIPYPGGSTKCLYLFLPLWHRPSPKKETGRLPQFLANTTFREAGFRGCRYFFMLQASKFARLPDRSHCCCTAAGQPRLLLPGRTCFVTSARTGYANRPNTGN